MRPDVVVEEGEQGFEVKVDHSALPTVAVDEGVRDLSKSRDTAPDVRKYLRGKLDQARWTVDAVEQRKATLLRVATAVFAHQRPFLEQGPGHLRPLSMSELAEWLGLHVSTVSRAVSGKHVQTPWGVLPLRKFFQASAGSTEDVARDDVREAVRAVVEAEDKTRPLSDDGIVAALAERGLTVARRTVAKYRQELGIQSSYRRREFR